VTENEITYGILESRADPTSTSVCIIRNIVDIKNHLQRQPRAAKFADIVIHPRSPRSTATGEAIPVEIETVAADEEAEQLLRDLRENKVPAKLPPHNVTRFEVDWQSAAIEDDKRRSQAAENGDATTEETPSSAIGRHAAYIDALCQQFYASVTKLITAGCSR